MSIEKLANIFNGNYYSERNDFFKAKFGINIWLNDRIS